MEKNVLIEIVISKTMYKELRNRVITPPTAQLSFNSEALAAQRAAKRSPITIGTGSHACIEIETHATFFPW